MINTSSTLAGETFTPGTYTIKWELKDASNTVIDDCTFDVEIQNYVGIDIIESNITISPNPTSGIFTIKNQEASVVERSRNTRPSCVSITDIAGKIIKNQLTSNNSKIDISNFPNGIYFVKIQMEDNIIIKKIIKK